MTQILWHIKPTVSKTVTSVTATSYSSLDLDGVGQKDFSLEKNYTLLDGSFSPSSGPVNFWSDDIGSASWTFPNFSTSPSLEVAFTESQTGGFTLLFDTLTGDYCRKFHVDFYDNGTLLETRTYNANNAVFYCDYDGAPYDGLEIIIVNSLPRRRAKIDGLVMGEIKVFEGNDIVSATIVKDLHLDQETIPFGTLTLRVNSATDITPYFASRQRIDVIHDGVLLGVFYLQDAKRLSAKQWQIQAVDGFGVLDEMQFAGDVYSGVGISAKTLAANIISGSPLTLDASGVSDITVIGLLMPQTCRGAFQQLLFRWGVNARIEGTTLVLFNEPTVSQKTLSADKIYQGATVEIDGDKSGVSLTAHDYIQNTNGSIEVAGNHYQAFDAVYSSSYGVSGAANVVSISGATLVPNVVGLTVLSKMYNYYARRTKWKGRIVWDGEDLGERMTFRTAWATQVGTIYKMTLKISGIIAAEVEALQ